MMKKFLLILSGFVLALAVFGAAGFAYAQVQDPPATEESAQPEFPYGRAGWSRGTRDGVMEHKVDRFAAQGEDNPLHEIMYAALAEALGLSVDELEARRAAGETMWQIAESQGYSLEEFGELMLSVRIAALEQAVAAGLITQEQADWMQSRWEARQASGYGPGTGTCTGSGPRGGMHGGMGGRGSGNQ